MDHKKLIQKIARKFDKNEDVNFHSENAVLLAINFGTEQDVLDAKRIQKEHLKIGYMPYELMSERTLIVNRLYPQLVEWVKFYEIKRK